VHWRAVAQWMLRSKIRAAVLTALAIILLAAVLGPVVSPYGVTAISVGERFLPPSLRHPFGTDDFGRDIFTRVTAGARLSLLISCSVLAVTLVVGLVVGLVAGFFGGLVDLVLMRITDLFLAFPYLVLAMAIAGSFGPSLFSTILALSVTWWASYARLVRAKILEVREQEYVQAAHAVGMSSLRVLVRHCLPNALGPIVVRGTNDLGTIMLASTILGFVGLGPQEPSPEWGRMVSKASGFLGNFWWYSFFSGLAIFVTVLTLALLGDELYESYRHRG